MRLPAILSRPTGFSDDPSYKIDVEVVAFIHGSHRDARGFDRPGEIALAVIVSSGGQLEAVPLRWVSLKEEPA